MPYFVNVPEWHACNQCIAYVVCLPSGALDSLVVALLPETHSPLCHIRRHVSIIKGTYRGGGGSLKILKWGIGAKK